MKGTEVGMQKALSKDPVKVIIEEGVRGQGQNLGQVKADPLSYCRVYGIIDTL
jgi:hypothetical protein